MAQNGKICPQKPFFCFTVKLKVLRLWYVMKLDINFGVLQLLTPKLEFYDH